MPTRLQLSHFSHSLPRGIPLRSDLVRPHGNPVGSGRNNERGSLVLGRRRGLPVTCSYAALEARLIGTAYRLGRDSRCLDRAHLASAFWRESVGATDWDRIGLVTAGLIGIGLLILPQSDLP